MTNRGVCSCQMEGTAPGLMMTLMVALDISRASLSCMMDRPRQETTFLTFLTFLSLSQSRGQGQGQDQGRGHVRG